MTGVQIDILLQNAEIIHRSSTKSYTVSAIVFDSRNVEAGCLFVAIRGTASDGHLYIEQAIQKGAGSIVCEELPLSLHPDIDYILVKNSAKCLALIASAFYQHPSEKLQLVGITGTNGKTTIATLLFRLFTQMGFRCGLLSTVENRIAENVIPSTHTTPDSVSINKLLYEMSEAGCEFAFMEVSSHAIDQSRIYGLKFKGGIFTNLTHDHLDYHKTFAAYLKAKKKFFDGLDKHSFALTNTDDKNGMVMLQNTNAKKVSYALKSIADYHARILENHFEGMLLKIDGNEIWFRLAGEFNASNLLAIYGTAVELGFDKLEVLSEMSRLEAAEGRFEYFKNELSVTGIVDYAHTPDALKNVLATIASVRKPDSRIIAVIGAGGDRDKTKRPEMASIAAGLCEILILTSDNPRSEDPTSIIEDMKAGITTQTQAQVLSIENRKEAIRTAALLAKAGDIILVAGKGHEKYQEIKGIRHPFDDKIELKQALGIKQ